MRKRRGVFAFCSNIWRTSWLTNIVRRCMQICISDHDIWVLTFRDALSHTHRHVATGRKGSQMKTLLRRAAIGSCFASLFVSAQMAGAQSGKVACAPGLTAERDALEIIQQMYGAFRTD